MHRGTSMAKQDVRRRKANDCGDYNTSRQYGYNRNERRPEDRAGVSVKCVRKRVEPNQFIAAVSVVRKLRAG